MSGALYGETDAGYESEWDDGSAVRSGRLFVAEYGFSSRPGRTRFRLRSDLWPTLEDLRRDSVPVVDIEDAVR